MKPKTLESVSPPRNRRAGSRPAKAAAVAAAAPAVVASTPRRRSRKTAAPAPLCISDEPPTVRPILVPAPVVAAPARSTARVWATRAGVVAVLLAANALVSYSAARWGGRARDAVRDVAASGLGARAPLGALDAPASLRNQRPSSG